ncbi:MAG: hypothetical protein ACFFD2_04570 [Promethearchaeota archaeon]
MTLEVGRSEIFRLLEANSAGKTTFIRILRIFAILPEDFAIFEDIELP